MNINILKLLKYHSEQTPKIFLIFNKFRPFPIYSQKIPHSNLSPPLQSPQTFFINPLIYN